MKSKYRAVSIDQLQWTAQVYISYISSSGVPVGWVDIKASLFFKNPEHAMEWVKTAGF